MSAMAVQLLTVDCGLSRWTTTTISSSHAMPSLALYYDVTLSLACTSARVSHIAQLNHSGMPCLLPLLTRTCTNTHTHIMMQLNPNDNDIAHHGATLGDSGCCDLGSCHLCTARCRGSSRPCQRRLGGAAPLLRSCRRAREASRK
jgi:hypothetical protein